MMWRSECLSSTPTHMFTRARLPYSRSLATVVSRSKVDSSQSLSSTGHPPSSDNSCVSGSGPRASINAGHVNHKLTHLHYIVSTDDSRNNLLHKDSFFDYVYYFMCFMCAYVYVFYDFILVLVFSWWFKFTLCKHVRLSYVFLINLLTYLLISQLDRQSGERNSTSEHKFT